MVTQRRHRVPLSVLMLCQFQEPVRGISPYGDALLRALNTLQDVKVTPVDFVEPYPQFLHPAGKQASPASGMLHWARPRTWRQVAELPGAVLHIQHWLPPMATYLAAVARQAKKQGKRVIVSSHNPEPHESLPWTKPFEQRLYRECDGVIVHNSRGAVALMERFALPEKKIATIPHGVRIHQTGTTPSAADYRQLSLSPERRYISIFGNLRGYKGIDIALSAWAKIEARFPDTDLVIAGRLWSGKAGLGSRIVAGMLGTDRDANRIWELLARPELSDRVKLLEGFQPDAAIDALIRISDVMIFPYKRFNSQSGAACRAVGMGCPVLVTDVGGLPDLAMSADWIAEPGDSDALAGRLEAILRRRDLLSDARKRQIGYVKNNSWDNIGRLHAAQYESLSASGVIHQS